MFYDDWDDDDWARTDTFLWSFLVLLMTIFLALTAVIEGYIIFYLGLSAAIILIVSRADLGTFQGNFLGSRENSYAGLVAGSLIGIALGLASQGSAQSLVLPTQALYLGNLNFFFSAYIAPLIEPLFWRGIVLFSVFKFLQNLEFPGVGKNDFLAGVLALLLMSYSFGFFHLGIFYSATGHSFSATFDQITFVAVFAVLFALGNSLFKSIAFEFGWHFFNNLFSLGLSVTDVAIYGGIGIVAFVVVGEFVERLTG